MFVLYKRESWQTLRVLQVLTSIYSVLKLQAKKPSSKPTIPPKELSYSQSVSKREKNALEEVLTKLRGMFGVVVCVCLYI